MESDKLICNFKDCYKVLNEAAFVTFCSHIFCSDHGRKLGLNLSGGCFACKKVLSDHEVVECNLNISANSKKLLLAGHDPSTIIEVASSALSFWNYQKRHEYLKLKRSFDHVRKKFQDQARQAEENESRINRLEAEMEKLKDEKQALKAELSVQAEEMRRCASKKPREDFF